MKTYHIKRFEQDWCKIETLFLENEQWIKDCGIQTKMQIAYDDDKLYLCQQTRESNIRALEKGELAKVCQDSCMEFFFGTSQEDRYFNFEVNFNCAFYIGFGKGRASRVRILKDVSYFNPIAQKTMDGWKITYEIPFSFIQMFLEEFKPMKGYSFKANCYKCGDLCEKEHYYSWNKVESPTPDFHRKEYFGEMIFD